MKRRTWDVGPQDAGARIERFVAEKLSVSEDEARLRVAQGAVYVQGRRCTAGTVSLGQRVMVVLEEVRVEPPPAVLSPAILFEDDAILTVSKPAGMAAQPTPARTGDSLLDWASAHLGRPAGLVHRLDRPTSGVTVFGKTPVATAHLSRSFREGRAAKRYLAAAGPGLPERGSIDLPLSKDPTHPQRFRATRAANGVSAQTEFQRLGENDGFCLVALFPRTGRTHQLRAHLAAVGSPIVGDRLYGGAEGPRCLLHAQGLRLLHPVSENEVFFEAEVPADLLAFFLRAQIQPPHGLW